VMPFDSYPSHGRARLGRIGGGNCRRGYGLKFMQRTGQTHCAYCGIDLTGSYENWLQMAIDHVVPVSVCKSLSIPDDWAHDASNGALACAACNGFANRFGLPVDAERPRSLQAFCRLRDSIFAERKALIADRHDGERAFYGRRLWEQRG
jgi:hypothetical protein